MRLPAQHPSQAKDEDLRDVEGEIGVAAVPVEELVAPQGEEFRRGERDHRRRSRTARDERHLAHDVAASQAGDRPWLPLAPLDDLQLAAHDDVHRVLRFALAKHNLPRLDEPQFGRPDLEGDDGPGGISTDGSASTPWAMRVRSILRQRVLSTWRNADPSRARSRNERFVIRRSRVSAIVVTVAERRSVSRAPSLRKISPLEDRQDRLSSPIRG